jgi:septal ring-binding cell division protein DamX
MGRSFAQGKAHKATLPKGSWTLRLEIACQPETVQNAAKLLDAAGVAHYSLPIKMNNGKVCTQIFSGSYKSREEAEAHVKNLPATFLAGGNKPRPFQVAEIPEKQ